MRNSCTRSDALARHHRKIPSAKTNTHTQSLYVLSTVLLKPYCLRSLVCKCVCSTTLAHTVHYNRIITRRRNGRRGMGAEREKYSRMPYRVGSRTYMYVSCNNVIKEWTRTLPSPLPSSLPQRAICRRHRQRCRRRCWLSSPGRINMICVKR